jgi:hypothetical protein
MTPEPRAEIGKVVTFDPLGTSARAWMPPLARLKTWISRQVGLLPSAPCGSRAWIFQVAALTSAGMWKLTVWVPRGTTIGSLLTVSPEAGIRGLGIIASHP